MAIPFVFFTHSFLSPMVDYFDNREIGENPNEPAALQVAAAVGAVAVGRWWNPPADVPAVDMGDWAIVPYQQQAGEIVVAQPGGANGWYDWLSKGAGYARKAKGYYDTAKEWYDAGEETGFNEGVRSTAREAKYLYGNWTGRSNATNASAANSTGIVRLTKAQKRSLARQRTRGGVKKAARSGRVNAARYTPVYNGPVNLLADELAIPAVRPLSEMPYGKRAAKRKSSTKRPAKRQSSRRVAAPTSVGYAGSGSGVGGIYGKAYAHDGRITVRHREYIADLVTGATANVYDVIDIIRINPGAADSFPWCANLAAGYEKYKFKSLGLVYEPQIGTDVPGTIMLAVDYDPSDEPPSDKQQMLLLPESMRSPVWNACRLACSAKDLRANNAELISAYPPDATTNPASLVQHDVGNLFVACSGAPANTTLGEIWIEYEVELYNPQFVPPPAANGTGELLLHIEEGTAAKVDYTKVFGDLTAGNTRTVQLGDAPVTFSEDGQDAFFGATGVWEVQMTLNSASSGTYEFVDTTAPDAAGSTVTVTPALSYIRLINGTGTKGAVCQLIIPIEVTQVGQQLRLDLKNICGNTVNAIDNLHVHFVRINA